MLETEAYRLSISREPLELTRMRNLEEIHFLSLCLMNEYELLLQICQTSLLVRVSSRQAMDKDEDERLGQLKLTRLDSGTPRHLRFCCSRSRL